MGSLILGSIAFPIIHLTKRNKEERLFSYSKLVYRSWNIFVKLISYMKIIKVNIEDIEKLKNIQNSVIVATHPSYIDVLILIALIPKTTCFAAERLTRNIFMKNIVGAMFLTAAQPLDKLLDDAKYMLDIGFNVLIFPMGKRHHRNEFPKIRKGAAQIALNADKNVVPIKLYTDINFLQENEPIYHAGNKIVIYDIKILDTIITSEFKQKYNDEIVMKKELTKKIGNNLYY
ncbi:1-acyl-sn-glycerol-3-phosphate acyltransferase [bacterium]|nr:1-acyl-sn-glycerol-3-phosphate acyltransferase [bacterium]